MYSGIVQKLCAVVRCEKKEKAVRYAVDLGELADGAQLGASIGVDGVCQTLTRLEGTLCWFDVIDETLKRTTLDALHVGRLVNVERSLCFGDEVGGHFVAGHVLGTATVESIHHSPHNVAMKIGCSKQWLHYILPKGFVAIDGVSLTVGETEEEGAFYLHLIPETLERTTLGLKEEGDRVNLEVDAQTQAVVTTVERVLKNRNK